MTVNQYHDRHSEIRGLVLENTFTCISDMVNQLFPFLRSSHKHLVCRLPSCPPLRRNFQNKHSLFFQQFTLFFLLCHRTRYIKRWILRLDWPSETRITQITQPILFLSGLQVVCPALSIASFLKKYQETTPLTWTTIYIFAVTAFLLTPKQ